MTFILLAFVACDRPTPPLVDTDLPPTEESAEEVELEVQPVDGFDFPVGPPNASGYYDAHSYGGRNYHLGEDWNGVGGGNTDLGDSVHAVADGMVVAAEDVCAHTIHRGSSPAALECIHDENGLSPERAQKWCPLPVPPIHCL
ncbi:MAG: hypothetical protein HN348_25150 [Proteobacteria bacterium]|jgi:hypothetical protein|nr:hypothetical protein [Pseudomonadota bacterium]